MIIEYEGAQYEFDFDDITVKQAMKIEKHVGMQLEEFGKVLAEGGNLRAVQAAGWLILHGGRDIPIEDCDFKLVRFGEAFARAAAEAEAAELAAAGAQPGPTDGTFTAVPAAPNGAAADPLRLSSPAG